MMKCLDNFFKMLVSKKVNNEPTTEGPTEIEEGVALETPKVVEPQYPNVKILIDNGHGNNCREKKPLFTMWG